MIRTIRRAGTVYLLVAIVTSAVADTLHVPYEYATIGEAIEAAEFGDTVLVAPGWYIEEVEIPQGISLVSEGGADETTIISFDYNRHVVVFLPPLDSRANAATVVSGFELSQQEEFSVPPIVCDNPNAIVEHCRIFNSGEGLDFGVAVDLRAGGTIRNCFVDNATEGSSIVTSGDSAHALIEDSVFGYYALPLMDGFGSGSETIYRNNTFDGSAIVAEVFFENTDFTMVFLNNIFYFGQPFCGSNPPDSLFFDYNCQWPQGDDEACDWGEHSFIADPLFCEGEEGKEWWLTPESPCIGTGLNGDDVGARWGICGVTGLEDAPDGVPSGFRVFPNPALGRVSIVLDAPAPEAALAKVMDVRGRLVRTVRIEAGARAADWDRRLDGGRLAPAGTYFLTLTGNGRPLTKRAVLIR